MSQNYFKPDQMKAYLKAIYDCAIKGLTFCRNELLANIENDNYKRYKTLVRYLSILMDEGFLAKGKNKPIEKSDLASQEWYDINRSNEFWINPNAPDRIDPYDPGYVDPNGPERILTELKKKYFGQKEKTYSERAAATDSKLTIITENQLVIKDKVSSIPEIQSNTSETQVIMSKMTKQMDEFLTKSSKPDKINKRTTHYRPNFNPDQMLSCLDIFYNTFKVVSSIRDLRMKLKPGYMSDNTLRRYLSILVREGFLIKVKLRTGTGYEINRSNPFWDELDAPRHILFELGKRHIKRRETKKEPTIPEIMEAFVIRSNETNLFLKFVEKYRAREMRDALRTLQMWKAEHGEEFAEKFHEAIKMGDPKADAVDEARRYVKSYFIDDALGLYELGSVTLPFLQKVTAFAGINILYDIVEPLEYAINQKHDKLKFERVRELCGLNDSYEFLDPIPVVPRPVEPATKKEKSMRKSS